MNGNIWELTSDVATIMLTLAMLVFIVRYLLKAPWWKTFEGRVLAGMMTSFLLILFNLIAFRLFDWAFYTECLTVTMILATTFMVYENVVLTRARRAAKEKLRNVN